MNACWPRAPKASATSIVLEKQHNLQEERSADNLWVSGQNRLTEY